MRTDYLKLIEDGLGEDRRSAWRADPNAWRREHREAYAEKYLLEPAGGYRCPARLLGKKHVADRRKHPFCPYCEDRMLSRIFDHESLWNRNGRPAVFVFQPYQLNGDQLDYLLQYCLRFGFELRIRTTDAWQDPETLMCELRADKP